MKKELLFERVGETIRLAVTEDAQLCEFYTTRGTRGALSGNLYVGRVQNVLPGMNAAFVDIGLKKNGYLPFEPGKQAVKPGQLILCRVDKEPGGSKGPRLTTDLSIPGKLCAILPGLSYAGVSKKIEDTDERDRLYEIAQTLTRESGIGIIVRTSAENETEAALRDDYENCVEHWRIIEREAAFAPGPRLLYADGDLTMFAARELLDDSITAVKIDDPALYEAMLASARAIAPRFADRIELWQRDMPLFDTARIDHQLEEALRRKVYLKSGATLVIDETEALTVIDVNTGKFTGRKEIGETILKTDLEAVNEIARQLRLRELGGIIIVDFIDPASEADREKILTHLKEAVSRDRVRTTIAGMTNLGLVEITRKKVRQPLSKRMMKPCAHCRGEGSELKYEENALQLEREIIRRRRTGDTNFYTLCAPSSILNAVRADFPNGIDGVELEEKDNAEALFQLKAPRNEDKR